MYSSSYNPQIPPQPSNFQRPRRNCFCCLFTTLTKFLIGFFVTIAIITLILWLVFRPNRIKVTVENAQLTRFHLSTANNSNVINLDYDLATNIAIRNPNKRVGVYYDWLESDAYYGGERFSWVALPAFYQGHKTTTLVSPLFQGTSLFFGDPGGDFRRENSSGLFNVDVWLYARVRYRFGSLVTRRYVARVKCGLGLKLATNATAINNGFTRTTCDVIDF